MQTTHDDLLAYAKAEQGSLQELLRSPVRTRIVEDFGETGVARVRARWSIAYTDWQVSSELVATRAHHRQEAARSLSAKLMRHTFETVLRDERFRFALALERHRALLCEASGECALLDSWARGRHIVHSRVIVIAPTTDPALVLMDEIGETRELLCQQRMLSPGGVLVDAMAVRTEDGPLIAYQRVEPDLYA